MSVIIRLQNLPWSANALDIRQYFHGLSIPEGGVHIVGGEQGDAFIAFSTDEDARQAFQRNNGKIKEVQINLQLSSRTEMQKVIEAARNIQTPFMTAPVVKPAIVPPIATIQPINQSSQEPKKEEVLSDSKSTTKDDRKSSRTRSRRTRSRSRSRDRDRKDRDRSRERSRDRRDRRRRDRSRSRDRRDKRRDRRDRSKSRERTRSKERDGRRRDSKQRTRSAERLDETSNHSNHSNEAKRINPWERNPGAQRPVNNGNQSQGLLGNFPGIGNPLDEARRSLNLIAGMQAQPPALQTNQTSIMNQDNLRGNMIRPWQIDNKAALPERSSMILNDPKQSLGALFQQIQQQRPILGQNNRPMGSMYQSNMASRTFNQDQGNNFNNRPFMNRPGMSDMMSTNRNSPDYTLKNEDYRRDFRKEDDRRDLRDENNASCIQLRPYWGGYGDLRRFFHGLFISNTGIKVVREPNGKRNGVIYIKFVRPESRQIALSKNGMSLKGYNVEISEISNEEFDGYGTREEEEEELESEISNEKKPFTCLVVEDIPSFAKEHDMLKMFSDYSLLGIDIQSQNRKRNAYILFNKEEDAQKALEETGKHILGGKQLFVRACPERTLPNPLEQKPEVKVEEPRPEEVKPIEIEDDLQIKEDHVDPRDLEENHDDSASFDTDVILMSGLPPKTTERDVIDFFSDIGLVPVNVHMILNKFGPSGECYCEFATPDEAISALDKNGMPLGNTRVMVEPIPRHEMEDHLGLNQNHPHFNPGFDRFSRGPMGPMGPPGGMGMGPPGGMGPRPPMPNRPMNQPSRFDSMGPLDPNILPPGCVIGMRNVPFKANVEEILFFFRNFDINHQSVMRRYNDNGHPTGDARVTFNSPQEAKRAFEECKFKKIRDRIVYLSIL